MIIGWAWTVLTAQLVHTGAIAAKSSAARKVASCFLRESFIEGVARFSLC
jgi:hypothetical protein